MKHTDLFDFFLENDVNLNQGRIDRLESHVTAIESMLENSEYGTEIIKFSAQGSWAHGTIIKPASSQNGFDADLVMFVSPNDEWEPKDYVEELYRIFKGHGTYKEKVHRGTRCVKIDYAGDFHLDIVPVIKHERSVLDILSGSDGEFFVCNRHENTEEPTNPEGYTDWLHSIDEDTGYQLRLVIRLMKYLRDIKITFSIKSILLTTLLGVMAKERNDAFNWDDPFEDLPTAFKTLICDLDEWLDDREDMPIVCSPVIDDEDYNRHWDQVKYENFRTCIKRYREWIEVAFDEEDDAESIKKWQRIFGSDFKTKEMSDASIVVKATGCRDDRSLVEAVKFNGLQFLRSLNLMPSYMERPNWPRNLSVPIQISVTMHSYEGGPVVQNVASGQPVPKQVHLRFKTQPANGAVPKGWYVYWRITNTGNDAAINKQLRGTIIRTSNNIQWEHTAYTGVHWVDAYLVNSRGVCVGEERFYVVIE